MRFILPILFSFSCLMVLAQRPKDRDTSDLITQRNRFEMEVGKFDLDFTVINGEEDGLGVIVTTRIKNNGKFNWKFLKLDTGLVEEYRRFIPVKPGSRFIGYEYSDVVNGEGQYVARPIQQASRRFIFLGVFITLSKNQLINQLPNL